MAGGGGGGGRRAPPFFFSPPPPPPPPAGGGRRGGGRAGRLLAGGAVKVLKLDVDANVENTMKFGVLGVPTLILFVDGNPVERLTGFMPKKRISERLTPHLSNKA